MVLVSCVGQHVNELQRHVLYLLPISSCQYYTANAYFLDFPRSLLLITVVCCHAGRESSEPADPVAAGEQLY